MSNLLDLHKQIETIHRWANLNSYPDDVMWSSRGCYPKEASKSFVTWLRENFSIDDQVGIVMLLRDCGINYTIFVHDDIPVTLEFDNELIVPLATVMSGRMGRIHSRYKHSKVPYISNGNLL